MSALTSYCWTSEFRYRLQDAWSMGGFFWDKQKRISIHGLGLPIVSTIGVISNLLSIPVLSRLVRRKKCPLFRLLLALAIADFFVTACYLVDSTVCDNDPPDPAYVDINLFFYDGTGLNGSSFDTLIYGLPPITNIFSFASNWCTVTVAAFRFIAVIFPLRASSWCSVRRSIIAIVAIYVAATVTTLLPFLFKYLTKISDSHYKVSFVIAYRTFSDLLPWVISIVLGSLLIASLRRQQALILSSCQQQRKILEKQKRITILLVSTAVWFVVLNVPLVLVNCVYVIPLVFGQYVHANDVLHDLYNLVKLTTVTNYAGNFFLYCCVNESYRKQIRKLISTGVRQKCCLRSCLGTQKITSQDSGAHLVPETERAALEQAV